MKPEWKDGEPANDAAAMADALEWLLFIEKSNLPIRSISNLEALRRCIVDLQNRLTA